jgi:hypothetical protein
MEYGGNPHLEKVTPIPAEADAANANRVPNGGLVGAEKTAGKDGRGTKRERKDAKAAEKKAEKLAMRQKEKDGGAA